MNDELRPGRGGIERGTTSGGKGAIFVRAEIVKDADDRFWVEFERSKAVQFIPGWSSPPDWEFESSYQL
jgi:hypothetical protein